jgi:NAD(P)-dependent dehydrogenase (short-subunit alcohol dehydrogenase family)
VDDGMAIRLDDKVVILTGGSRGIGKAMAFGLLAAGARVVLVGRDPDRLRATAENAEQLFGPNRATGIVCDIRDVDAGTRLVDAAFDAFDGIDVLINNAALGQRYLADSPKTITTRFWESDPDRIREAIDVNVTAPFLLAAAVTPHLLERGWGRIINLTTSLPTLQRTLNSPYGPTKAALEVATLIWAQELGGTGVTVNSLIPGRPVNTEMVFLATGPLLAPEIMVPPIVWLVSGSSDAVTGARFVASRWDPGLPPNEAAQVAREDPILRRPQSS